MQTPTRHHFATIATPQDVEDTEGHVFTLRRLNALDKLRLFKAAGPTLSQNHLWLGMATLACSVIAIDGVPVPSPASEAQVESLVARLGDAGINAVARALAPETEIDQATHAGN